jgi:hypothetical protein
VNARCYYCEAEAQRSDGGQALCAMHYRFRQMRGEAKRRGKVVPTWEQLTAMAADVCPDCGVRMNWLAVEASRTVATLQHYRDGTMALVCKSCNSRHTAMPGDSYCEMPKDHKWCGKCRLTKPFSAFSPRSGSGYHSYCKPCSAAYTAARKAAGVRP